MLPYLRLYNNNEKTINEQEEKKRRKKMSHSSLSEEIQERMYKNRIEKIQLMGGKSREELIKRANNFDLTRKNRGKHA